MNLLHPVYEILAREGGYAYNNPAFNQTEINAAIQLYNLRKCPNQPDFGGELL